MLYTLAAYLMWGLFPAFFPLLLPASPLEILAHRILWTAVLVTGFLFLTGGWRELRAMPARTWAWMLACGMAVTINWGTYVVAVNNDHVADAALGYFINPLVSVALGVIVLKEALNKAQMTSIGIAFIAVLWLTFANGQAPYISLALAFSFGIYGLLKKQTNVSSTASVAAETIVMLPIALGYIGYLTIQGESTFGNEGATHTVLMICSGLVTALPLLCFAKGAKLIPLATVGMLQYTTPILQVLWAVYVTQEHMPAERWIGFGIIWVAVIIYLADLLRQHRKAKKQARGPVEIRKINPEQVPDT
ncbi:RarD protein [Corynebacterium camporealensis]|uniref:RarD protein n=1 Tax=Corynebacterium camporealensis TaxID=161896 RepID=A0A0F6TB34_9CORY|nr:EamA family transporter RarD [Corynebacterium camporealensis]AKE39494.1 rarD protein [Corynebacterium camporealensis]AVH88649.1 RarD protein [Corynebacterium camporealensis]